MNKFLSRYIEGKAIDLAKLSPDEKVTLDQWENTLAQEPVTIESLTEWLEHRKAGVGETLGDLDNSPEKIQKLVIWQSLIGLIIKLVHAPKAEREALEIHLQSMLDEKEPDKL